MCIRDSRRTARAASGCSLELIQRDVYTINHDVGKVKRCLLYTSAMATPPTMADVIPACAVKTYPVYHGDVFDRGGVQLEVIGVPGHSVGLSLIHI